jgi:hypothetical protein
MNAMQRLSPRHTLALETPDTVTEETPFLDMDESSNASDKHVSDFKAFPVTAVIEPSLFHRTGNKTFDTASLDSSCYRPIDEYEGTVAACIFAFDSSLIVQPSPTGLHRYDPKFEWRKHCAACYFVRSGNHIDERSCIEPKEEKRLVRKVSTSMHLDCPSNANPGQIDLRICTWCVVVICVGDSDHGRTIDTDPYRVCLMFFALQLGKTDIAKRRFQQS